MLGLLSFLLSMILLISGAILFFLFGKAISQSNSRQKPSSKAHSPQMVALQKELLTLVYGNQKVANRLVTHIHKKYPHKDKIWCLEKAISDLEKDRR